MLNRLRDVGQTAVTTGERAIRLLWDLVSIASERLREAAGPDAPPQMQSPASPPPAAAPPRRRPSPPPATQPPPAPAASPEPAAAKDTSARAAPVAPQPAEAKPAAEPATKAATKAATKSKGRKRKTKSKAKGKKGKKRPDQLIRVLELLAASPHPWLSAKELSEAGEAAGTPILPGNVRKVIRGRGEGVIETRPREGSRRGALEYRITDEGYAKLKG
jgi:hypothetical protein